MLTKFQIPAFGFLLALVFTSCATYYELNYEFNRYFESGDLESAQSAIKSNSRGLKKKTRFLYFANRGVVANMLGNYEASNVYLEKAYIYGEDYQRNYADIAASFLTNPNIIDYPGEDHEHLLLLYYKSLNYLHLNDHESALVECRRLNNRLNALSDKYRSDNKFRQDAFIHTLMGLIYDAGGDYNNAFIAYRNAYNIYQGDYSKFFNLTAPEQLKRDLLRTAYQTGFMEEVRFYEKEFGVTYQHSVPENGELVFFWNNGLGPVKDEWSVNFVTEEGDGGVVFVNDEYGWSFPFDFSGDDGEDKLTDLEIFRISMPKYVERTPRFSDGALKIESRKYPLELAEDVNAIAFKSLEQRILLELGKSLMRAALKKTVEEAVEEESEGWGFVVGLVNAATEKADTRNWQTIPHSILYTRIPLEAGNNEVVLQAGDGGQLLRNIESFSFEGSPGKTLFHAYQTLN